MIAAARRLTLAFTILLGGTVVVSLLIGALLGTRAQRSVSLGLDCVGAFLLVIGFFVGVRGPLRLSGESGPHAAGRLVQWAKPDERVETINVSALFVTLGFALVVIGLALDPRYSLL